MTQTLERTDRRLDLADRAPVAVDPPGSVARRRRGRIKGLMSTIAGAVLCVVAVLAIFLAVSTHFEAHGQLGVLGHPVMSVLSGSMAPTINTGDLVIDKALSPAQAATLHVGQIISFRAGAGSTQIFTHRIAAVQAVPGGGIGYVTKGDANDSRDGPVTPPANVVGRYQSKVPDGGYVLNDLHRPIVLGLVIAAALLWLVSEPLWRWVRQDDGAAAA